MSGNHVEPKPVFVLPPSRFPFKNRFIFQEAQAIFQLAMKLTMTLSLVPGPPASIYQVLGL